MPDSDHDFIRLDQFLKHIGIAPTGGMAKVMIQMGDVSVNGEAENRRGRKLVTGDVVMIAGQSFDVTLPLS